MQILRALRTPFDIQNLRAAVHNHRRTKFVVVEESISGCFHLGFERDRARFIFDASFECHAIETANQLKLSGAERLIAILDLDFGGSVHLAVNMGLQGE